MFRVPLFILAITSSQAQNIKQYDLDMQTEHAKIKGYDTTYRVNYFENIILKATLTSDVANLRMKSGRTGEEINLKPVAEHLIGLSFDYKWIALGISFTPNFLLDNQHHDLNDSNSFGLSLNFFYSDRWRQELKYQRYEGFISTNTIALNSNDEELLANTTLEIFGGSTYFIANRNYSFRAHYAQTERQLKSAGSLIPKLSYSYGITKPNIAEGSSTNEIDRIDNLDIRVLVGYLYTFVHKKKWFVTAGIHPGIGYNNAQYNFMDGSPGHETFDSVYFAFDSELALGYNNYRWFFGAKFNYKNYNYTNIQNGEFNREAGFFNLYFGYRFNDNKPMRKFFGWFEDTFGF